ncbi:MAG: hypothetical protein ACPGQL_06205 [Thermoplasmatota archaeon]
MGDDALRARLHGLNNIIWAIASSGIFLTYGTALPWMDDVDASWLYGLLWGPGIALGVLASNLLWRTHGIARRAPERPKRSPVGWIALFAAFAGVVAFLAVLLGGSVGPEWPAATVMVLANGVFLFILGSTEMGSRTYTASCTIAGAGLAAIAMALTAAEASHGATHLLAALAAAVAWGGSGLVTSLRARGL